MLYLDKEGLDTCILSFVTENTENKFVLKGLSTSRISSIRNHLLCCPRECKLVSQPRLKYRGMCSLRFYVAVSCIFRKRYIRTKIQLNTSKEDEMDQVLYNVTRNFFRCIQSKKSIVSWLYFGLFSD